MTAILDSQDVEPIAAVEERRTERRMGGAFWRLWTASAVSNLGDGLAFVAFPLLAASLTHDPRAVAAVMFAQRIPWLFFALPAGALADRINRARAMATADAVRAAALVALGASAAAGTLSLPQLYATAFLLGSFETLFAAASHAALPSLVRGRDLDRANGLLYATETGGAELMGPAIGGLLFAAAASAPFALDGATFAASALLLYGLRFRLPAPPAEGPRQKLRRDIAAAARYFRTQRLLRLTALLVCGLAFFQSMVLAVLVLLALVEFGLSTSGYGLFLATGAVGSIAGGLAATRVRDLCGTAVALTGAAVLSAGGYVVMATTSNVWIAAAAFAVEAFAVACGNVATISLRQSLVPDELRGRVGNLFRLCIWGGIPVGALASGVLAEVHGVRAPILLAGLGQLALAVATMKTLRREVARESVDREDDVIDLRTPLPAAS